MHTLFKRFTTPAAQPPAQHPLPVNGKTITSLQMLLSETQPEELYPLLRDHSLLHWLIAQGQDDLAYKLAQLLRNTSFFTEFRSALGFPAEHTHELSEEELRSFSARKERVAIYTDDETALSNPYTVAFNQNELNEILFLGIKTIYLCEDAFRIPLAITGVHYIGIGGAVVKQPLSHAEYHKNGIVVDEIPLPEHPASHVYKNSIANDSLSRYDANIPKDEISKTVLPPFLVKGTTTHNPNSQ